MYFNLVFIILTVDGATLRLLFCSTEQATCAIAPIVRHGFQTQIPDPVRLGLFAMTSCPACTALQMYGVALEGTILS
jgi:hypothetical protein